MILEVNSEADTKKIGQIIGSIINSGRVLELIGDVGSGKTTLVKGLAVSLGIVEYIQSPSFTINRVYDGKNGLKLSHYDFYRLNSAGIMANELHETIGDPSTITVIEWAELVNGVLPADRVTIKLTPTSENRRKIEIQASDEFINVLEGAIANDYFT